MANDKDERQEPSTAAATCTFATLSSTAYPSTTAAGAASSNGSTEQQQQQPQQQTVVLVPPTAASCASILPRWATLEFPLPIESVASTISSSSMSTNTTTKEMEEEKEQMVVILSREEANIRTQTFHSISLQLDDACQKTMHRLYVVDVDKNKNTNAAAAVENIKKSTMKGRSIQQALQTLFQETTGVSSSSSLSTLATNEKSPVPATPRNDDDDDDTTMNELVTTRKRELLNTGEGHPDVIEDEEPAKRVRLGEKEKQQQPKSFHAKLLRNRFLAAIATTTASNSSGGGARKTMHVGNKDEKNSLLQSSLLLLPVLLMQGPYHAMDRFTWMQFLVEQSRRRQQQRQQFCPKATAVPRQRPSPPPAVVWLRPAAGLATSWPEEILRQLLLLLQSTANNYSTANPQLAAQARLAWTACCHCPLTGRRRRKHSGSKSSSSFALVGRILQTWARHVEGLFSGIVVYVDVLDTIVSSSLSNVNTTTGANSATSTVSPTDHSSASTSSSLHFKDLLAWLSHQRAGHGLPVSCVLMVPVSPTSGHGLLSFDSSSSLQGVGAGLHVREVVLPTTDQFLTTLEECLQGQEQQGNSSSTGCRLLQLVQQIGSMINMNQHEQDPDAQQSSISSSSSMAAIPALMDWKRCVAQMLTRRSSFLSFWLLQNQQQQQQYDLKLHVSWFLRHGRGREFLLQYDSNKNALPLEEVGISSCSSSSSHMPSDDMHKNKNDQTPHLWQWLQQSRQWHLLVEMAGSIEQACRQTTSTIMAPPLLLLLPASPVNPDEQNDQPLEYDSRRTILAILFRYRQELLLQSQPHNDYDKAKDENNIISCMESHMDTVDEEYYGQCLSRYLLGRSFANDEHTRGRVLHQINQLVILVDQCTQVSQVHCLVVAPILKGWTRHLEWLFSSSAASLSSSSVLKSLVQQAQPRRQTTTGLLAQSLGSTSCLPISSLERLPGILYGLILNRVSIPQEEWFFEYFQRLRQYQQQTQEQRYSRQEAFALFCCGTQYLKILGLIKERRRQQRPVGTAAARAAVAGGGQHAESATTTTPSISGIVYDKISLIFCGGNG